MERTPPAVVTRGAPWFHPVATCEVEKVTVERQPKSLWDFECTFEETMEVLPWGYPSNPDEPGHQPLIFENQVDLYYWLYL